MSQMLSPCKCLRLIEIVGPDPEPDKRFYQFEHDVDGIVHTSRKRTDWLFTGIPPSMRQSIARSDLCDFTGMIELSVTSHMMMPRKHLYETICHTFRPGAGVHGFRSVVSDTPDR